MQPVISSKTLSKKDRIDLFFKIIRRKNQRFDNPSDTHAHLKKWLNHIEDKYALYDTGRMSIFSLQDFKREKALHLFYKNSNKQQILLHENGAYGIYQNHIDHFCDFDFYKAGSTRIIEIESKNGLSVWEHATD